MTDKRDRAEEIEELMRVHGLAPDDAAFVVALRRGEIKDAVPDIRGLELLSPEERAASGFDLTLEDLEEADRTAKRRTA